MTTTPLTEHGKKQRPKPRKELPTPISDVFAEWKAGKPTRTIAKECGLSPGTIRNMLRGYDSESYRTIARSRASPRSSGRRIELAVSDSHLFEQWSGGESTESLAKKYDVSRQTMSRRLKNHDARKYNEIAEKKTANSISQRRKILSATATEIMTRWKNGEPTPKLAEEFKVDRSTITKMLEKCEDKDYQRLAKERMIWRKAGKPLIPTSEVVKRWKNGERIKDIAEKYGVSYTVIRRVLMANDEKTYAEIARIRRATTKKQLPVTDAKLYRQWKKGMSTRTLAKRNGVSRQTITRRLEAYGEQEYKEIAGRRIAESIAGIARYRISVPPPEILKRYTNGESASELADELNVSRPTVTRLLEKCGGECYERTARHRMLSARTKELLTPVSGLFDKWENGETPENLEELSGISYRQFLEKLKAYDPIRYKRVAERRGLGSSRAKQYGARSLFELNVRRILEKYGIQAKETTLKLGRHPYRPDCLIADQRTIVEAMGLNSDSYWKHQKKKTKGYLRYKYSVIVVVPTEQVYRKALMYLSGKVEIVRYHDFEDFVRTYLRKWLSSSFLCNQEAENQSRINMKDQRFDEKGKLGREGKSHGQAEN